MGLRLGCVLGHDWGLWSKPEKWEGMVHTGPAYAIKVEVTEYRQQRICDACGRAQIRKVSIQ